MTSIRSIVCIPRLWLCLVIVIISIKYSQAENFPVDPENEPKKEVHIEASHEKSVSTGYMGASGSFVHGFIATLSVILVSELGDKTFFIAAIMAMRHPRWTVFIGAMAALAIMHVLSGKCSTYDLYIFLGTKVCIAFFVFQPSLGMPSPSSQDISLTTFPPSFLRYLVSKCYAKAGKCLQM